MNISDVTTEKLLTRVESLALTQERDSDDLWQVISELHQRDDKAIFLAAKNWVQNSSACLRALGADIIGQLGCTSTPAVPYGVESLPILIRLSSDREVRVRVSAIHALGHHASHGYIWPTSAIAEHANDGCEDIRHAVAVALGGSPCNRCAQAVEIMCFLCEDDVTSVRNWATFGLGVLSEVDTPQVRDVLVRRLEDSDDEIQGEAAVGLAGRRDPRVIDYLQKAVSREAAGSLIFDAILEYPNSAYVAGLENFCAANPDDDLIADALQACRMS